MSQYAKIAKRKGNKIRKFILVNPYLGKHVPIEPDSVFRMFNEVSKLVPDGIVPEQTLVIGFAETATALGIHYAAENHMWFIQTTRETVPGHDNENRIAFTESHSHAPEQYILADTVDEMIRRKQIKDIIFVDDEITTGNTILKAVSVFMNTYGDVLKFHAVSVLNGMNEIQTACYENLITLHYLEKIHTGEYNKLAEGMSNKDIAIPPRTTMKWNWDYFIIHPSIHDTRTMTNAHDYTDGLLKTALYMDENFFSRKIKDGMSVLVLGTEEFMYPGLTAASFIQKKYAGRGVSVHFHATTRSPIETDENKDYPLHARVSLASPYSPERETYLYDLAPYDYVFVLSEAKYTSPFTSFYLMNAIPVENKELILL